MNAQGSLAKPLALTLVALGLAATAGAKVHLQAGGGVTTHDCGDDPVVEIDGSRAEVRLTGACDRIDISGTRLTVRAEGVGKVEISGLSNRLEWQYATGGRSKPSVEQNGVGHEVVRVEASAEAEAAPAETKARPTAAPAKASAEARASAGQSGEAGASSAKVSVSGAGGASATVALEAETSTSGIVTGSGNIQVRGDGIRRRIDCGGSKVQIVGDDVVALLLGDCPNVQVSGDRAEVWIERVDNLQILGTGSKAFYVASTDGDRVKVSLVGPGASASAISADELAARRKR